MTNNEDKDVCRGCGGKCCKQMPGGFSVEDIGKNAAEITQAIKSGIAEQKLQIDWWEADPPIYYVRAALAKEQGTDYRIYSGAWGGVCIHLGPTGCALSFEKRPKECRELLPKPDHKCICNWSKSDCKDDWKKHQDILKSFEGGN